MTSNTQKMINAVVHDIMGDTHGTQYSESTYLQLATALAVEGYTPESAVRLVKEVVVNDSLKSRADMIRNHAGQTVVFGGELVLILDKV